MSGTFEKLQSTKVSMCCQALVNEVVDATILTADSFAMGAFL